MNIESEMPRYPHALRKILGTEISTMIEISDGNKCFFLSAGTLIKNSLSPLGRDPVKCGPGGRVDTSIETGKDGTVT